MFEYTISKIMADELLKVRKGESRKMRKQEYLCAYINEQFNLLHPVTRVHIEKENAFQPVIGADDID